MHPYVLDAELLTFVHRCLGRFRTSTDDDSFDSSRNRSEIVVAGIPLDLICVRVDREHFVAPLPKSLVHDVAAVSLRVARHSRYCDALAGQEVCGRFFDGDHLNPFRWIVPVSPRAGSR